MTKEPAAAGGHVWYDGRLMPSAEWPGHEAWRAIRYGDGLFDTLRVSKGVPLFFTRHYSRLILGMETLGMEVPEHWQLGWLREAILRLTEAQDQPNARVRMQVWRTGYGRYASSSHAPSILIESEALDQPFYGINREGLVLDVAESVRLSQRPLDRVKGAVAMPYVLAAREREQRQRAAAEQGSRGPDELLLLNSEGRVAEATASNLFAFRDGVLFTPPEEEGGIPGVLQRVLLQVAKKAGIPCKRQALELKDLDLAEELFLTNAIRGMRWVGVYRGRELPNQFSVGLFGKLEEKVLSELSRPWPPR
jgi:branched-chain amino acid aminotransferase